MALTPFPSKKQQGGLTPFPGSKIPFPKAPVEQPEEEGIFSGVWDVIKNAAGEVYDWGSGMADQYGRMRAAEVADLADSMPNVYGQGTADAVRKPFADNPLGSYETEREKAYNKAAPVMMGVGLIPTPATRLVGMAALPYMADEAKKVYDEKGGGLYGAASTAKAFTIDPAVDLAQQIYDSPESRAALWEQFTKKPIETTAGIGMAGLGLFGLGKGIKVGAKGLAYAKEQPQQLNPLHRYEVNKNASQIESDYYAKKKGIRDKEAADQREQRIDDLIRRISQDNYYGKKAEANAQAAETANLQGLLDRLTAKQDYGAFDRGEVAEVPSYGQAPSTDRFVRIAEAVSEKTGIPAEFIYGQMAHETGHFTHDRALANNNFAGLHGGADGKYYPTDEAFVEDYADFYNNGWFSDAKNARTVEEFMDVLRGKTNGGHFWMEHENGYGDTIRNSIEDFRAKGGRTGGQRGGEIYQEGLPTYGEKYYTISDQVSDSGLTELTEQKLNALAKDFRERFGEDLYITSMKRHGDGSSWHDSGQAIDIAGGILETSEEARAWLMERGKQYGLVGLDEYANPSPHATGGHIHFSDHGDVPQGIRKSGGAGRQTSQPSPNTPAYSNTADTSRVGEVQTLSREQANDAEYDSYNEWLKQENARRNAQEQEQVRQDVIDQEAARMGRIMRGEEERGQQPTEPRQGKLDDTRAQEETEYWGEDPGNIPNVKQAIETNQRNNIASIDTALNDLKKQRQDMLDSYQDMMLKYKGKGVEQGTVYDPEAGRVRYKFRTSNNDEWYQDFYKTYGRPPRKSDFVSGNVAVEDWVKRDRHLGKELADLDENIKYLEDMKARAGEDPAAQFKDLNEGLYETAEERKAAELEREQRIKREQEAETTRQQLIADGKELEKRVQAGEAEETRIRQQATKDSEGEPQPTIAEKQVTQAHTDSIDDLVNTINQKYQAQLAREAADRARGNVERVATSPNQEKVREEVESQGEVPDVTAEQIKSKADTVEDVVQKTVSRVESGELPKRRRGRPTKAEQAERARLEVERKQREVEEQNERLQNMTPQERKQAIEDEIDQLDTDIYAEAAQIVNAKLKASGATDEQIANLRGKKDRDMYEKKSYLYDEMLNQQVDEMLTNPKNYGGAKHRGRITEKLERYNELANEHAKIVKGEVEETRANRKSVGEQVRQSKARQTAKTKAQKPGGTMETVDRLERMAKERELTEPADMDIQNISREEQRHFKQVVEPVRDYVNRRLLQEYAISEEMMERGEKPEWVKWYEEQVKNGEEDPSRDPSTGAVINAWLKDTDPTYRGLVEFHNNQSRDGILYNLEGGTDASIGESGTGRKVELGRREGTGEYKGETVTQNQIWQAANELFGIAREGSMPNKKTLGYFDSNRNVVRIGEWAGKAHGMKSEWSVLFHEIGHRVDKALGGLEKQFSTKAKAELGKFMQELYGDKLHESYRPDQIFEEGFANFLAEYVCDPESALRHKAACEEFGKILARDTDLAARVYEMQDMLKVNREQPDAAKIAGTITSRAEDVPTTWKEKAKKAWERVLEEVENKRRGLHNVDKDRAKKLGRELTEEESIEVAASQEKSKGVALARVLLEGRDGKSILETLKAERPDADFKEASLKMAVDKIVELRDKHKDWLKQNKVDAQQAVNSYLLAKHFDEVYREKYEKPLAAMEERLAELRGDASQAEAANRLQGLIDAKKKRGYKLPGNNSIETYRRFLKSDVPKELKEAAQLLWDTNDNLLTLMVHDGLISKEVAARLREEYPHYCSLARDFPNDAAKADEAIIQAFGGTSGFKNVGKPLERLSEDGSTYNVQNPLENYEKNIIKITSMIERNNVGKKLVDAAEELGMPEIAHEVPGSANTKHSSFYIFKDGKKVVYETTPEIYRALGDYTPQGMYKVIDTALRIPARWLRAGATTANFSFGVVNYLRDNLTAWTMSGGEYRPFADAQFVEALKGIAYDKYGVGKGSKLWNEYKASGAQMATEIRAFEDFKTNVLDPLQKSSRRLKVEKTLSIIEHLENINDVWEQATRLGLYKRRLDKGGSRISAAHSARSNTLDFGRGGRAVMVANRYIPFLNAGIQGTSLLVRRLANPKTRGKVMWQGAKMTVASLAIHSIIRGDDDYSAAYDEAPEYVKDMYWLIPCGKDKNGKPSWLRIPKPFGEGMTFASLPTRMIDYSFGYDKDALKEWGGRMLHDSLTQYANPVELITNVQAAKPIWELTANYDSFRKRDIVPDYMRNLKPEDQYDKGTSEFAKGLGRLIGVSPKKIDHAGRGFFGGLYGMPNDVIDSATTDKPYQDPITKRLTFDADASPRSMQRYYDRRKELQQAHASQNKTGRRMDAKDLRDYRVLQSYEKYLKKINQGIQAAEKAGNEKMAEQWRGYRRKLIKQADKQFNKNG